MTSADEHRRGWLVVGWTLVAAGSALRFAALGTQDPWADEGFTWSVIQTDAPLAEVLRHSQGEAPFFYVLTHLMAGPKAGLEVLRLIPALFGTLALVLQHILLRRYVRPCPAVLGTALMAFSAFQVYYSQELRTYSLVAFLGVAVLWLTLDILEKSRPGGTRWVALAICEAALVYSHYLTAAFLLGLAVVFLLDPRTKGRRARWFLTQCAAVLLFSPWIGHMLTFAGFLRDTPTITDFSPLRDAVAPYLVLALGKSLVPHSAGPLRAIEWAAVAGVGVAVLAWVAGGTAALLRGRQWDRLRFLLGGAFLPLGFVLAVCVLGLPRFNFVYTKYVIWIHAPLVLLAAVWMESELAASRRWTVALALILWGTANLWGLGNYFFDSEYRKAPAYRELVSDLANRAEPRDAILCDWLGTCQSVDALLASDPRLARLPRGLLVELRPEGPTARLGATSAEARLAPVVPCEAPRVWIILFRDWRSRREPGFEAQRLRLRRQIDELGRGDRFQPVDSLDARGLEAFCLQRR